MDIVDTANIMREREKLMCEKTKILQHKDHLKALRCFSF